MALLAARSIAKSFAARTLFEDVSFEIAPHDKAGLVGVNGCGKTTLFQLLTGALPPDAGEIYRGRETKLGTVQQIVETTGDTLLGYTLHASAQLQRIEQELERVAGAISAAGLMEADKLVLRQSALQERYEAEGGLTYRSRTRSTLLGLGFSEAELEQPLGTMSGGQRNKAQLARLLLSDANLLLLDEPTNHLDMDSVRFLEDFLRAYNGAFIVISHDRYFLDRVTERTLELKHGRLTSTLGNYSRHMELTSTGNEILRRHYANQKKEIRRLEGVIEQQKRWNQARNYVTIESKRKQIERLKAELVAPEADTASIRFRFAAKAVSGNDVLLCSGLRKAYDRQLFEGVSFNIYRGERVFLLGANGCGKTTLLRLIMGKETPDAGSIRLGANIQPGYYEQTMDSLQPGCSALEEIQNAYPHMDAGAVRAALAAFLLTGDDVFKRVATLSGGEKARIQLLKLMLSGANLLLLDEPTNHLDIDSRDALERALESYDGTLFIVTHDRYLVNQMADRILYLDETGLTAYVGGYDDFLAAQASPGDSAALLPAAQEEPAPDAGRGSYRAQKERQGAINRATGELRRAEERVTRAEIELHDLQELLASPAVASDYLRSQELADQADLKQCELDALYAAWEQAQAALDALEGE
ncbi:MAG: ABC-F family ATP-binding cassette domain-containing protein [Christensenellaceae bacterium]|jgi:ATP-binding cassette subfamily F protein 3|nr:ABC-F family ATP-binding cassette domain-containing protein [Christensenellaceae bacterium]